MRVRTRNYALITNIARLCNDLLSSYGAPNIFVCCFIVALSLVCTPAIAQGPAGIILDQWCGDHSQGGGDVGCTVYLRGIMDGIVMATTANDMNRQICFPKGVTLPQVRLIVEKYMAENPDKLHDPAAGVAYSALYPAFACKTSNWDTTRTRTVIENSSSKDYKLATTRGCDCPGRHGPSDCGD